MCQRSLFSDEWLLVRAEPFGLARYLSVTDQSMEAFKTVARYYANQIPCFSTEEIDLEEGDYVEVVQGAFRG